MKMTNNYSILLNIKILLQIRPISFTLNRLKLGKQIQSIFKKTRWEAIPLTSTLLKIIPNLVPLCRIMLRKELKKYLI